ncbi:hypothetical protein PHJA_000496100 [Phtheirospermum japonicum]|uniref:Uncharacterized protein n=1 Tax=Phtheirospermum japonicum TaxID=374723 RepID=A0A830B8U5_9LAMI|nr:hypothetical protein PHJA_000496100 [Phtheirospermum japonicum]
MGLGAPRSIIRPLSRILFVTSHSPAAKKYSTILSSELRHLSAPIRCNLPWMPPFNAFHSLTDTRYPKRRPIDKPRPKRAALKPPGPYAWVQCVSGEPIPPNQPNEGSAKKRNEKKRIKQHRTFIMCICKEWHILCFYAHWWFSIDNAIRLVQKPKNVH